MNCEFAGRIRRAMVAMALLIAVGCSGISEEASSQTQRVRQTDKETAKTLEEMGWEITYQRPMYSGKFTGDRITDDMLMLLHDFNRFTTLDVSGHELTDSQITIISELKNLMFLNLSDTGVTDQDLQKLVAIPMLNGLDVTNTKVTPEAVAEWSNERKENPEIGPMFKNTSVKL